MNNQKDYTIAEFMTLPSEGKVYGELIDPQIELRSMTTAEEMRRLAPNDHQYENLCTIIDDSQKKYGKYKVSADNGINMFNAYADPDIEYFKDTQVYVKIVNDP